MTDFDPKALEAAVGRVTESHRRAVHVESRSLEVLVADMESILSAIALYKTTLAEAESMINRLSGERFGLKPVPAEEFRSFVERLKTMGLTND